jgi:hypothetical protein
VANKTDLVVHYSIADATDDDLAPLECDCWPCLDYSVDSGVVDLVWVTEPSSAFTITAESMRWRIPPGVSATGLRHSLAPGGGLNETLMEARESMKAAFKLFRSCDVAAETLDALSEINIRR